ncbi:hypothetical protein ACFW3Z_08685 [Nocardiopsis alba]|jgi:hypothetical protein|uniref:DUF7691 family protein n=1 Tax=Nocardiopsis alba TaxID=53437 RepID=UPI0033B8578B
MSSSLSPYVVDLDVLHSGIGSKDDKLRRMIGGRFKKHLDFDDQQFDSLIEEGAPNIRDAIRTVIEGGPFDDRHGTMYSYAYKWMCEFHGRFQVNGDFCPMKYDWLEMVDEGLEQIGVTAVDVSSFSHGSVPSPIPSPVDLVPGYGEWSLEQCREALEQWEAATDEAKSAVDSEVLHAIETCMGWCRNATALERGVAAFFF